MKEGGDDDGRGGGEGDVVATAVKVENQRVPFHKLLSFADRLDVILMIVGTIGAIANGLSQPLMTLIFGQLIDSFGSSDQSNVVKQVSKVRVSLFAMSCRCRSFLLLGFHARSLDFLFIYYFILVTLTGLKIKGG